jgi:3'(2'), 5'-bisphosphate nucleotidase
VRRLPLLTRSSRSIPRHSTFQQKTDKTPVTGADLASEQIICAMLTEAFPDIPIASGELVEAEGLPPSAARFWAVDPLDGTREFIAKNGEFAVNIGLVENGIPILVIVHGPAVGVTYAACGPGTATRRRYGGPPEPIRVRTPSSEGLVVIHSRSHDNSRLLVEFLATIRCASARNAAARSNSA